MAIVTMEKLLARAEEKGIGCGSFSVYNMEAVVGAIKAAEDLNTPIIIQLAEGRFGTAPLEYMGPMMVGAAINAKVDIGVHLDHGQSSYAIKRALELGFTSIMYDGSAFPLQENINKTKAMVAIAKKVNATTEAELGHVGQSEDGTVDHGIECTNPNEACKLVEETGIDALAVAIGNQHGNYKAAPHLRFDVLQEIHKQLPKQRLVLHGGSGISDQDFQRCITYGIRKINIATAILNAMTASAKQALEKKRTCNFYEMHDAMVDGAYETIAHHIKVFNMENL